MAAAHLNVILRSYCNEGNNALSIHEIVNVGTRHGEEWVCQFDNHPVHCCRARHRTSQDGECGEVGITAVRAEWFSRPVVDK